MEQLNRKNSILSVVLIIGLSIGFVAAGPGSDSPYKFQHSHSYHSRDPNYNHNNHPHYWDSSPELKKSPQKLEPVFQWRQLDFDGLPDQVRAQNTTFNAYNNVPLGIAQYKDRMFIGVPRRQPGIASTLNFVSMADTPSPKLKSYPNYDTNRLGSMEAGDLENTDRIISVYRPRVDYTCDRLWFVDTGLLEYGERIQVQRPSIWIIDLKTGKRLTRFEFPQSSVERGNSLASLTIDVEPGKCDSAFAYIPDFFNFRLHVFSLAENRMWSFTHSFFHIDPLYADFRVAGFRYQWRDGIFSITLGPKAVNGSPRKVFFHSMSSINEYQVSTAVLKNSTNAARGFHGDDFEFLGRRQELGQSAMHAFDQETGVLFYSEVARNGVGCWNSRQSFLARNHDLIFRDDLNMIYPADLTSDEDGKIWVLSNSMPVFAYSRLNASDYNFKIWRGDTKEMIKGTACQ